MYLRAGSEEWVTVRAIKGSLTPTIEDADGFGVTTTLDNFIIGCSELPGEPLAGDLIEIAEERYEVADTGMGVWRYTDPYRTAYRVFTRRLPDGDIDG